MPQFYVCSNKPLTPGSVVRPETAFYRRGRAILDAGRSGPARSMAVSAAETIVGASAIGAIREYSPRAPLRPANIYVYRAELSPFHVGPLALVEALDRGDFSPFTVERLREEYWAPTMPWHLNEVLGDSATILCEVPSSSERDRYMLQWVEFNRDREQVRALLK